MGTGSVRVDVLAEQRHLFAPAGGEGLGFPHDTDEVAAAFASAGVRDHAESAEVVAAPHDGDPASNAFDAVGGNVSVGLVLGEVHHHAFPACGGPLQQVGQG